MASTDLRIAQRKQTANHPVFPPGGIKKINELAYAIRFALGEKLHHTVFGPPTIATKPPTSGSPGGGSHRCRFCSVDEQCGSRWRPKGMPPGSSEPTVGRCGGTHDRKPSENRRGNVCHCGW